MPANSDVLNTLGADPGRSAAAVTPSDSTDLSNFARALWIGGAGSGALKITTIDGTTISFAGVPAGFFPIACRRVWSTGTGVTDIVAVW